MSVPVRRFHAAVAVVTVLRLWTAASVPLSGDEAYYWEYAHHLALGYHDHPPLVAWIIALATGLLGRSTLAVRAPFVLLGAGLAELLFDLTRRASGREQAGLLAGAMTLVTPLFTVAGLVAFPDSGMLFAAALGTWCFWRALAEERRGWWLLGGAAAGLAGLGKLTGLYLLPCVFLLLAAWRPYRRWLRRPEPYLAAGAALVVLSPFVYWNDTHGWESVAYQYGSRLGASHGFTLLHLPTYVAFSALALSPVVFGMVAWATLVAGWQAWGPQYLASTTDTVPIATLRRERAAGAFCFLLAAPIQAFFLACSLVLPRGPGIHWAAPGLLGGFCAFGIWADRLLRRRPTGGRLLLAVGMALALATTALIYGAALAPASLLGMVSGGVRMAGVNRGQALSSSDLAEILGYPEGARSVRALLEQSRAQGAHPFLITTNYTLSSALAFYSGDTYHVIMGTAIGAEFDRWDDFPALLGRDAIFVDTSSLDRRADVSAALHQAFARLEPLPPIPTSARGVGARTFYVVYCHDFRSDVFTRMKATERARSSPRKIGLLRELWRNDAKQRCASDTRASAPGS